jgi:tetratricopeptide (TPR) repeat protein
MTDSYDGDPDEYWRRVEALFEQMQDAADPLAAAAAEADIEIADRARRLWQSLKEAESKGFLAGHIELIPSSTVESHQFNPRQILAERFEIHELLGTGGMGEVYLAFDRGLNELVAIKTIRARLAQDPAVRRRFLAEVQNARRVTHPNVCRINDLFDEGGLPFLSMQYLAGERLSTWLEDRARKRSAARHAIAVQLAEALAAAHRVGILHCDFKPANVILTGTPDAPCAFITDFGLARALRAPTTTPDVAGQSLRGGTLDFMAPELQAGESPSVATDIYAYGCVLAQLLPGHRIASRCADKRPEQRPHALDSVIRDLRGDIQRRRLLGAGIATVAAGATYTFTSRPGLRLAGRTRIAINGFRSGEAIRAGIFRDLLITALRQSALLTVVADDRLRSLLRSRKLPTTLPADRAALIGTGEIALVVEGSLAPSARGLKVLLDVFTPAVPHPTLSFQEEVGNSEQLVQLADQTALRLRQEFGESASALRLGAGYTPLAQVTSASPEAVTYYYRGRSEQQATHTESAIALYDQALRLDPLFALAHSQRGIALAAHFQSASAVASHLRAFELRGRVTERERLMIEVGYFGIIFDQVNALKSAQRLIALFPEEPGFQRDVAFYLVRTGRPLDALSHSQLAAELDSSNDNNLSEWMGACNHANRFEEALRLCKRFREEGHTSTLLDWGRGVALMGLEEHAEAVASFEAMGVAPERDRWAKRLRCGALMMDGRFQEAATALVGDLAFDAVQREEAQQQLRRSWLAKLEWLMDRPLNARVYIEELLRLESSPRWLLPWREAALTSLEMEDAELARQALTRIREIAQSLPSTFSQGAAAHIEGAILASAGDERASGLLAQAAGLLADPLTLYSLARWQMSNREWQSAAATLEKLEEQRGWVLRLFCPVNATLARIHRARCYLEMSRIGDGLRLYGQVFNQWRKAGTKYRIVAEVEAASYRH